MKTQKMFYTVQEIARILLVSNPTIRNLIQLGKLNAIKCGRSYRVSKADLERLLSNSPAEVVQVKAAKIKKPVKTLYAQVDAEKYDWLRKYRIQSGRSLQAIMNECLDDFQIKHDVKKRYVECSNSGKEQTMDLPSMVGTL